MPKLSPRLAGLMTRALSAQMYATHRHTRLPCAVCMSSLNPIIGCTLLDTSQTTLPVPCYVLYTSSYVCCRLHVIRVTMHYRLRAVCSPHGLTNTCARQASGSVSRCVSLQYTSVSGFSTVAQYSQCSEDAHSAMPPVAQHTSEPKPSALIVHSASITVRQQRSNSCGIEYYRPLPLCT